MLLGIFFCLPEERARERDTNTNREIVGPLKTSKHAVRVGFAVILRVYIIQLDRFQTNNQLAHLSVRQVNVMR